MKHIIAIGMACALLGGCTGAPLSNAGYANANNNIAAMLEDLGHTVFEAASGGQALDILRRKERINLVVTDQAMPGMSGAQLADAIAADWPDMPIVIATGFAEMAPDAAADLPHLPKSFDQAALARAVAAVMRSKRNTASVVPFKAG